MAATKPLNRQRQPVVALESFPAWITAELKAGMLVTLDVVNWNCHRSLTLIQPKNRYLLLLNALSGFIMGERFPYPKQGLRDFNDTPIDTKTLIRD
ncbi:MAG: hypothetical protein Ct9H300mP11_18330 [Chloroflexota bacterium]|nr:MAG: hypothetical protein Ct9H300mP11_18330 [Chloroflexota bacterium]